MLSIDPRIAAGANSVAGKTPTTISSMKTAIFINSFLASNARHKRIGRLFANSDLMLMLELSFLYFMFAWFFKYLDFYFVFIIFNFMPILCNV